jgi:hypothetical protein
MDRGASQVAVVDGASVRPPPSAPYGHARAGAGDAPGVLARLWVERERVDGNAARRGRLGTWPSASGVDGSGHRAEPESSRVSCVLV